jgi:hypothetical protein
VVDRRPDGGDLSPGRIGLSTHCLPVISRERVKTFLAYTDRLAARAGKQLCAIRTVSIPACNCASFENESSTEPRDSIPLDCQLRR